jgi:O-antigen ligase
MKVVFFAYIFISLMGIYEAVTRTHVLALLGFPMIDRPWVTNPSAFRICGPSGDPDYYAISVIFGLMVTFAVLPLFKSTLARMAVLCMTMLHFLAIVATASRGAAMSVATALGVFYLFARFRHKLLVGLLAFATLAGGFVLFSVTVSSRAAARYTGEDVSSWDERWGWIRMCWAMMMDAPIRGTGSGQFVVLYDGYRQTYAVPRLPSPRRTPTPSWPPRTASPPPSCTSRPTSGCGSCSTGSCAGRGIPRSGTWPSASWRWRCRSGCSP